MTKSVKRLIRLIEPHSFCTEGIAGTFATAGCIRGILWEVIALIDRIEIIETLSFPPLLFSLGDCVGSHDSIGLIMVSCFDVSKELDQSTYAKKTPVMQRTRHVRL